MIKTLLLHLGVRLFRLPRLKKWALLEDKKYLVIKAIETSQRDLPLFDYVSMALLFPKNLDTVYWKDTVSAFISISQKCLPDKSIPLVYKPQDKKSKPAPWEYSGRLWYFYCSIIASAFGWPEKQIANLSVKDGLAYIQEILTEKHFEHEFHYRLSELAYEYDKQTKKSKYKSMEKPYWMLADIDDKSQPRKTVPIRKSLLPVGNVIAQDEEKTNKTNTPQHL